MSDNNESSPQSDSNYVQDLDEEQIVQHILDLGNEVLQNMGIDQKIDDVSVFFSDAFYIQFFQQAFHDLDFGELEEAQNEEDMAMNIQALIDLLSQDILKYDLGHIRGDEIVAGNPEHCINLLQLAKEISSMMASSQGGDGTNFRNRDDQNENEDLSGSQRYMKDDENDDQQIDVLAGMLPADEDDDEVDHQDIEVDVEDSQGYDGEFDNQQFNQLMHHNRLQHHDDQKDGNRKRRQHSSGKKEAMHQQLDQDSEDEDGDLQDFGYDQNGDDEEVSLDIHDAIATAEGINSSHKKKHGHGQRHDMYGQEDDSNHHDEDEIAREIADIVDGSQDQEDDDQQEDYSRNQMAIQDNDQEDEDEMEGLENQISPDLMAVAQQMGIELDSEQIQQLQKMIEEQNFQGDDEEQEDEEEDNYVQEQQPVGRSNQRVSNQQSSNKKDHSIKKPDSHHKKQSSAKQQSYQQEQEAEEDDESDNMVLDVDELNEEQKKMLMQYLQEEYEKNPDEFQLPKEKLEEILAQGGRLVSDQPDEDDQEQDDAEHNYMDQEGLQEMHGHQMHHQQIDEIEEEDDYELEIEGGEQKIEEDGFPTEQEMIEQNFTQEQIEQVLMMKQQAQAMQQQQENYGEEDGEQEYYIKDQHQMQHIYKHPQPQPIKQKKKKAQKAQMQMAQLANQASRYQQSRVKSAKTRQPNTNIKYRIGQENLDPNPLQRLMVSQSNNLKTQSKLPPKKSSRGRPSTAKVKHPANSYKQFIAHQTHPNRNQRVQSGRIQPKKAPSEKRKHSSRKRNGSKKSQSNQQLQYPSTHQQMNTISHLEQGHQEDMRMQQQMPVFNEEFINQLNEEQLQQLIQQQQALISQNPAMQPHLNELMHQQRSGSRKHRSRSSKRKESKEKKATQRAQIYGVGSHSAGNMIGLPGASSGRRKSSNKRKSSSDEKKRKQKKRKVQPGQGVLMNNFFPALEGGNTQASKKATAEEYLAAQQAMMQGQEQIINEVPQEEEGESQDIMQNRMSNSSGKGNVQRYQNQLDEVDEEQDGDENDAVKVMDQDQSEGLEGEVELTEEQLVELLQNADKLSPEQQAQLQHILKDRWKNEIKSQKQLQYDNIYNILTENVAKAKVRLANLGESPKRKANKADEDHETLERILRQKKEYENLVKAYNLEQKNRNRNREMEQKRVEKQLQREMKLKQIREKKFEEELMNQQKSLMYKRNAQQVRLCQKVYKLASDLEKNKLLEEKRHFKETQEQKLQQKKQIVDGIESFYKDKIQMLKERIENEKFERRIAQTAQVSALSRMRKELQHSKKGEIEKYLVLLKQEDQKYDFQSSNMERLEQEILKLYKK